ncbi:MAG TPA: type I restriction endonuclease [Verrucomicrobiota bacterium]|nr:type I restriction endonuclease [Verrucomicrobiota bacterium]HNU51116.1 type I restriction endonuclease [Verrucomicrobiota bacterium]
MKMLTETTQKKAASPQFAITKQEAKTGADTRAEEVETIPLEDLERQDPCEYTEVEYPMLKQLAGMGWKYLRGDLDYPQKTERENFRETVLRPRLRAAIRKLNLDPDGNEYLDDLTIERAMRELERSEATGGLAKNKELTEKLARGVKVAYAEKPAWAREDEVRIRLFDFEAAERNDFLAVNQFRVEFIGRQGFVIPDIVLFVNGIPLAVVECKSPAIIEPMNEGINQLLRYSNQREDVAEEEGVPHLFHFNQLMVSTWFYETRAAGLGAQYEFYQEWKDTHPVPLEQVAAELGKEPGQLKSQEILTAGMLRPAHLLDILRNFVLFSEDNGKPVKIVPRYQQYRAAHKIVERLKAGKTRQESGDVDERGGVVGHTQGSGKSITMVYVVRKMRTTEGLHDFKIVLVTDRTQLEKQLRETMALSGQNLRPNKEDRKRLESPTERVQRILREEGPDLVFCMIQKSQDHDPNYEVLEYRLPPQHGMELREKPDAEDLAVTPEEEKIGFVAEPEPEPAADTGAQKGRVLRQRIPKGEETFPILNESNKILLLVDEGHRDQAGTLHANLMTGLPNAAKVAFTGTPIFKSERANTFRIFGPMIDEYGMRQSVDDEATVRILYEGRIPEGLVERAAELDTVARFRFRQYTEAELQVIMNLYATQPRVLEAPKLIGAKADDMLRHYVREILPGGFKAQVVATSRLAAMRYQEALQTAKDKLVVELEALDPTLLTLPEGELAQLDEAKQYLVAVHPMLARIKKLEFAAVISHNHNDPPSWGKWSDQEKREEYERQFKLPLEHPDPAKCSGLAFLCVQNMLLTGFDAPVEQVIYVDRLIREHALLQAIARVNRKKRGKEHGYVVDYIGIAQFLKQALQEGEGGKGEGGGLETKQQEIPRLEDRHRQVMDVFRTRGVSDITDIEACVDLLADAKVRADFIGKLRLFYLSLDVVLPLPEGKKYLRDAKILGFIAKVAANLYRDSQLNLLGVAQKVRQLIDEYISAQGVNPAGPPVDILDTAFEEQVKGKKSAKSRASEMLHAIRYHISIHLNEDPERFKTLSQKLDSILQALRENWNELEKVLREFLDKEVREGREETVAGIQPKVQAPFFDVLKKAAEADGGAALKPEDAAFPEVVKVTVKLVGVIQAEIRKVDFWRDMASQQALETTVYNELRWCRVDGQRVFKNNVRELATRIRELAYHRRRFLVA